MASAGEPHMVPGYRHRTGLHCSSVSLRNLLGHHGIEVSEEMALGLAAAPSFFYVAMVEASPTRLINPRAMLPEQNFVELTDAPLRFETFEDPEAAWEATRASVDAGRPPLVVTDLYYLEHYGGKTHFPGHSMVLVGYDDEAAFLSDGEFEELQRCSLPSLRKARFSSSPPMPLSGQMLTVTEEVSDADITAAAPRAIARAARQMLEPTFGVFEGLPAVRSLAEQAASWPEDAEDWQWCARFAYQAIERRGTGGGSYRLMYSRFLAEAGYADQAPLAAESAAAWTELAQAFREASNGDRPDPEAWRRIGSLAGTVFQREERLWTELAEATAGGD